MQDVHKDVLFYERVNEIRIVIGSDSSRRSEIERINVISVRDSVFETHTKKLNSKKSNASNGDS